MRPTRQDIVPLLTARGESLAAFDGRCIPAGCVAPRCRVEDGRGHDRRGKSLVRLLSQNAGALIHTITPFPVSAHRTGRADCPHLMWLATSGA